MGYGSRTLQLLQQYYEGQFSLLDEQEQTMTSTITSVSSEVMFMEFCVAYFIYSNVLVFLGGVYILKFVGKYSYIGQFKGVFGCKIHFYKLFELGLGDLSNTMIRYISSVKPVLWLVINIHHLLLNGEVFNTQSHRSLTSYAISRSLL